MTSASQRQASSLEYLPTIDASPYGDLSPDRGGVLGTLAGLARLAWEITGTITVTSATTLIRRVMHPEVLVDHSYLVAEGKTWTATNAYARWLTQDIGPLASSRTQARSPSAVASSMSLLHKWTHLFASNCGVTKSNP